VVYRKALAAAPASSVWISSIGFTTNIEALLKSPPDKISPLNGTELVAAKVKGIAWMGGAYPASGRAGNPNPEHNFGYHKIGPSTYVILLLDAASNPRPAFAFDRQE
jgi:inosine-uridine nucleoside N-ribohydrolase